MIGAFFDIDGTLMRESIMVKHFKKLVKYGIIDEESYIKNIKAKYEAFEKRYGDYDDYISEIGLLYKEKLMGINKALIVETAKQVIKEEGELVYTFTRDRIKWHQDKGHKVFFVSGSPTYLVKMLGKVYNIDDCSGTDYVFDSEGNFTGEISQMWDSDSKLKEIKLLVEKYDIDIENSYAYGDTNGDYSMLKTMKNATAINPSKKFLDIIRDDEELTSRVDIVVERKDVIYHVNINVDHYRLTTE
ncbi:HAD family hydrolase [Helcococcus bovis]|uniref:HAD family hydrolase n=1 Tax=Helcococcus bovis TaxID=3153252 RepID=UPI0038BD26C8